MTFQIEVKKFNFEEMKQQKRDEAKKEFKQNITVIINKQGKTKNEENRTRNWSSAWTNWTISFSR